MTSVKKLKLCITTIFIMLFISNNLAFEINSLKKYEDTAGQISLKEILNDQKNSTSILKYSTAYLVLDANTTYWFYLEINNPKNEYLVLSTIFMLYDIEYHFLKPNGVELTLYKSGFNTPIAKSILRSNNHTVPVPIEEKIICIIKLRSAVKTGIGLEIETYNSFVVKLSKIQSVNWTLFGLFTFAALYAIIFFITTHKKIYLYYLMYISSFWLFMISINHSTYIYFSWLELPFYNKYLSIPHYINTISLIWYSQHILDSLKKYRFIYKCNIVITILLIVQFLVALITDFNLDDNIITFVFLAPTLFLAIKLAFNSNRTAIYIILGILLNLMAFISLVLNLEAILPAVLLFGIYGILDIILFGVSISLWLRNISKENELNILRSLEQARENQLLKAEQNTILQQQVLEKTKELNNANVQLNSYLEQIAAMNHQLEDENENLKINVETQTKARSENKLLNFKEFSNFYPSESKCYDHIAAIKWANGFACSKCSGKEAIDVREEGILLYKRCVKCRYPETVTAKTLFHKNKIDILKAFYICYVTNSKKQMTIEALSDEIVLRKATTFNFIQKVKKAMLITKKSNLNKDGWSHLIMTYVEEK